MVSGWTEDKAATYLWQQLLTSKGYTVKLINADIAPTYEGLKANSIQLYLDEWLPHDQGTYWNKVKSNAQKINQWYASLTKEGFVVPDYVTNVQSISDLKSHASEFGNKIVGIEPGAGEMRIAQKAITHYGLPETLQASSTPAMLSALSKAESSHSPIVVTLWSPHWAFAKWQLRYLKDPKNLFGPPDNIYSVASNQFIKDDPTVVKWLKNFKLTQKQVGTIENMMNQYPNNPQKGVKQWISQYQQTVNSWIK